MRDSSAVRPVTAVIVTYQSGQTIAAALAAARRCHDAGLLDAVIVDNNSTDSTRETVERDAAWARHEFTGINNGFGRGCNIGFAAVDTPYAIFINPDAVVEPDALQTMLTFMEKHPKVGIVGPSIIEGEGTGAREFQHTGPRPTPWTTLRNALPFKGAQAASSWPILPGSPPERTGWVCGAVFMIRTDLMRRLNGFDPRFFMYWEETDVCRRAEAGGFETWAVGDACAHHVGGASSSADDRKVGGCIAVHYYQSRFYYMAKHHGTVAASIAEFGEFILLVLRTAADVLLGRGTRRIRPRLQTPLFSKPGNP